METLLKEIHGGLAFGVKPFFRSFAFDLESDLLLFFAHCAGPDVHHVGGGQAGGRTGASRSEALEEPAESQRKPNQRGHRKATQLKGTPKESTWGLGVSNFPHWSGAEDRSRGSASHRLGGRAHWHCLHWPGVQGSRVFLHRLV